MVNCRKCKNAFIELTYDELSTETRAEIEQHLESCASCATVYAEFKSTLSIMDQRERTEPDPVFWTGYWDRLSDRFDTEPVITKEAFWKKWIPRRQPLPQWTMITAGAVALLLIGVFIGKIMFNPTTQGPFMSPQITSEQGNVQFTALEQRTQRYIQRSKVLLLGLINFDPATEDPYTLNLPQQQRISEELVQEAGFLKSELNAPAQNQLRSLIADLEVILLQIANLESEQDLDAVEMVKHGVDRRGILLKIDLREMRKTNENTDSNNQKTERSTI